MKVSTIKISFFAILFLTFFGYFSGLNSRFILDDLYNLQGLGEIEAQGILYYLLGSGFSGAAGRPVSLLSFAIQYSSWPDNPFSFKLINLVLHIINGVLVFFLASRLYSCVDNNKQQATFFALLVSGLWLLHPIHVNTVLYIIQRMTQIAAFFSLIGMLAYIQGRTLLDSGRFRSGISWICFSIFGCTLFAILGKENGILLPVYLMIIEFVFYSGKEKFRSKRMLLWSLLLLPVVVFFIYLLLNSGRLAANFIIRDFSPWERILTEFTVVINYLKLILLPHPGGFSLYHDGYPVSKGILSPPFTLISILLTAFILILSISKRKKYPLLTLGILLFFFGHLLEAGPFSLDLYFEHRNYLPALGVIFVIAWGVITLLRSPSMKIASGIFISVYSLSLLAITADQTRLWSTPEIQLIQWVSHNPDSRWARQDLANYYFAGERFDESDSLYIEQIKRHPRDIYPYLRLMHLYGCRTGTTYPTEMMEDMYDLARSGVEYNLATLSALDYLVLDILKNECMSIDPEKLERLIHSLIASSGAILDTGILFELLSSLSLYRDKPVDALSYIRESLERRFGVDRKLREIFILGLLQSGAERKAAIDELKRYLQGNLKDKIAYDDIVSNLD